MINRFHAKRGVCLFLILAPLWFAHAVADESDTSTTEKNRLLFNIQQLDKQFAELSAQYFQNLAHPGIPQFNRIEALLTEVKKLEDQGQTISSIQLLYTHEGIIRDNIDHPAIFDITDILLQHNEQQLARQIFELVKQQNDDLLLASLQFVYARYHARRQEWKEVYLLLKDSISELSEQQAALAYLLRGTAQQHLKKHRQASADFSRVVTDSPHYLYAQLNSAIADIRQGWLAEAQSKIKRIITLSQQDGQDEITQRLYLVMGYAFLQKEYYRDARDSFRKISQLSQYANKALLGIALTASSQDDYVGSLNALNLLKEKKSSDLAVDEAYLIIPYVYEKLQDEMIISASYSEAMTYYQQRIQLLDQWLAQEIKFDAIEITAGKATLQIEDTQLILTDSYPGYFFTNYLRLKEYLDNSAGEKTDGEISRLITAYNETLQRVIQESIEQRKQYLNSYLNQCRYGLARLYDDTLEVNH